MQRFPFSQAHSILSLWNIYSIQRFYAGKEGEGVKKAVKDFLNQASNDEGIYNAMSKVLGVQKDEANSFWRQKVQEFGT